MNMKKIILVSFLLALAACASKEPTQRPAASVDSERSSGAEHPNAPPIATTNAPPSVSASDARAPAPLPQGAPEYERGETSATSQPSAPTPVQVAPGLAADDTGKNARDAHGNTLTSGDQKENSSDLELTRRVRAAIVGDSNLSFNSKNVKIVTQNGRVTLRGPVKNAAERSAIVEHASQVAGAGRVDSQLEVER
jgi:hypothetical protein